jgi:hypothetical protein
MTPEREQWHNQARVALDECFDKIRFARATELAAPADALRPKVSSILADSRMADKPVLPQFPFRPSARSVKTSTSE